MTFPRSFRLLEYSNLFPLFLLATALPFTAIIGFAAFIIVYLVSCFFPSYGQFISYSEVLLDQDANSPNQSSIVISMTLDGDLSLDKLRTIFVENVLDARSQRFPNKLRYPKLKQYLTSFLFFRIWKNDPDFRIENHVVRETWNREGLETIHWEYLNKPYKEFQSPWELVLIRKVNFNDHVEKGKKSIIVLRVHHVMADAKSLQKLLVECLGNKKLKTANPQYIHETRWDSVQFVLLFPFKLVSEYFRIIKLLYSSFKHPWSFQDCFRASSFQSNEIVIALSSKIAMSNLKRAAYKNNVRTSAVVMSIIAGAIRRVLENDWKQDVGIGYPLPKPNHPESLTNHLHITILRLPTNQQCAFQRVQQCNQEFIIMRDEQRGRYLNVAVLVAGFQIYPISSRLVSVLGPIVITNNAGEEEGFSVGDKQCIDFCMSVGVSRGQTGVGFCTISYKDEMRIAITANKSILTKNALQILAKHIDLELQILLETPQMN